VNPCAVRFARDPPAVSWDGDEWGTRLADVRVPSWYGLGVLALTFAALYRSLRDRKQWDEAEPSIREASELLVERMVEGDKRDERVAALTGQMAAMTTRMEQYGRTSVKLAAASLMVALSALVVAVVVAVAG
jgi:Flp pilus assembly protein TadB